MKVKEKSEKAGLKLNIQKSKIMASSPITPQQTDVDGNNRNSDRLLFSWAPKSLQTVTAAMKLKDAYFWEKSYGKSRQCIKKQRHHFADKGPSSQSYDFFSSHVWMWELDHEEGWAPKNWCFWTVVLEKTLESPWTARRSNQSILKEINPENSLEGLMLKLKFQYLDHLMQRANSLEKTLTVGKVERKRSRWQTMGWLAGITDSMNMIWANSGRQWGTEKPRMLQSMGSQRVGHDWATEQQQNMIIYFTSWYDRKKICLRKILIYLLEKSITKCFKWVYSKVRLSATCPYIPTTIPTSVWK